MNPLLRFLFENPIIVLVLVAWLVSGLASMAGKAARRAQQQQQQRRRAEAEAVGERDAHGERHAHDSQLERRVQQAPMARPAREARPAAPQTAEDIARELRQMLGLDPGPDRPHRGEAEAYGEEPEEAHPEVEPEVGDRPRRHVAPPRAARAAAVHGIGERGREPLRLRPTAPMQVLTVGPARAGAMLALFEPGDAARAIIAMEVLGPPRSLRPHDFPQP